NTSVTLTGRGLVCVCCAFDSAPQKLTAATAISANPRKQVIKAVLPEQNACDERAKFSIGQPVYTPTRRHSERREESLFLRVADTARAGIRASTSTEKIFIHLHFLVACRFRPCILQIGRASCRERV